MSLSTSNFRFFTWNFFYIGTVIIIFLIFIGASEWLLRTQVEPNDHYAQSINVFFESDRTKAVFGDSISLHGFRGQSEFVNLALPGETLERTAIKIRGYFQRRIPQKVILGANYNVFQPVRDDNISAASLNLKADTDPRSVRNYEEIFLQGDIGTLRVLRPPHRQRLLQYWKVFFLKGKFETKFRIRADGSLVLLDPEDKERYARMDESERTRLAQQTVVKEMPGNNIQESKAAEIYRSILSFLREQGADVCLVTYPMAPEFRRMAAGYETYAAVPVFFEKLAKEYSVGYINFWDRLTDPADFINENHLSPRGATKIAAQAVNDCFEVSRRMEVESQASLGVSGR